VLTASREMARYYEDVWRPAAMPEARANWVMGDLPRAQQGRPRDRAEPSQCPRLAGALVARIVDNTISGKIAKEVFEAMWAEGSDADAIIEAKGLRRSPTRGAIEKAIDEGDGRRTRQLADYRAGKDKLFGFFVGQVMKATGGKANPAQLNELLMRSKNGSPQRGWHSQVTTPYRARQALP
jgi:aspartyl-tRNA(Asn)/glutamyl-tRNA(Gln) amidotransferase subunit B